MSEVKNYIDGIFHDCMNSEVLRSRVQNKFQFMSEKEEKILDKACLAM